MIIDIQFIIIKSLKIFFLSRRFNISKLYFSILCLLLLLYNLNYYFLFYN